MSVARGTYLAFTDSDCVPDPQWLERGVAALNEGADVVQGLTVPERAPRTLERSLVAGAESLYATCNVFYRRGAFESAGGFDAGVARRLAFRTGARLRGMGFGEDTILGWRVRRSGRAHFVPDAVVRHHVHPPDVGESLRRAWSAGAFAGLVREVPELRHTMLVGGVFLATTTRVGLYASCLLLVCGRRGEARLALAGWVTARAVVVARRERSVRTSIVALPVDLAREAITAAALALGSARARTVVL